MHAHQRPQLAQHPAHGDVGYGRAVPIRHELEFSEKLLEECPAAPPDEGGNQHAIRDAIREKLLEECPAAPSVEVRLENMRNQYAISMQSVCHQSAPPVEVRLVHAHRDGRHLPGRRRKPKEAVREPASRDSAEAGKLQTMLPCKCEHAILRPQVNERVLDLDEWRSVAISGNQWQSVALSSTQWHSVALSGNQWHSVGLKGTPWRAVARTGPGSP